MEIKGKGVLFSSGVDFNSAKTSVKTYKIVGNTF
jgi:hypothetical protein